MLPRIRDNTDIQSGGDQAMTVIALILIVILAAYMLNC